MSTAKRMLTPSRAGAQGGLVRGEGGVVQIVDGDLAELRVRRHGEPDGVHERFGIFHAAHERARASAARRH